MEYEGEGEGVTGPLSAETTTISCLYPPAPSLTQHGRACPRRMHPPSLSRNRAAVDQGFEIHHAEKEYIMLTLWLPAERGVPNTLPGYTSHSVGVGAVVINADRQVLVVQERSGPAANSDFWKYPTGMVDPGEVGCLCV